MVPMYARVRRVLVEERIGKLAAYADEEFPFNSMEINDPSIGFISSEYFLPICARAVPPVFFFKARDGVASAPEIDFRILL